MGMGGTKMKLPHTTFDLKDNKLVKRPDRPIKVQIGGKTTLVKPDSPFYNTIAYYSVKKKPYETNN